MSSSVNPNPGQNAADRLYAIFNKGRSLHADDNKNGFRAWAEVFELTTSVGSVIDMHEVTKRTVEVGDEVGRLTTALHGQGIPSELFVDSLATLGVTVAAVNLGNPWKATVSNYMKPEVMLALRWCAYVLPKEDHSITADELAELLKLLASLDEKLDNPELPSEFVRILRAHLEEMRQSMKLYSIRGTRVLREAVRKAVVDIQLDIDEIRESAQTSSPAAQSAANRSWSEFVGMLSKVATAAGDLEKLGTTFGKVVGWTGNLLQLANDTLSG